MDTCNVTTNARYIVDVAKTRIVYKLSKMLFYFIPVVRLRVEFTRRKREVQVFLRVLVWLFRSKAIGRIELVR